MHRWSVALAVSAFAGLLPGVRMRPPAARNSPKLSGEADPLRSHRAEGSYPGRSRTDGTLWKPGRNTLRDHGAARQGGRRPERRRDPADQRSHARLGQSQRVAARDPARPPQGKTFIAYLESATTHDYLVAAACDQIVMPESGELAILGLRAEVTFFKNLFDWLHLKADMLRVGEYKSAAEPFVAHRDEQGIPPRDGGDPRRLSAPDRRRHQQVAEARSGQGPRRHRRRPLHGAAGAASWA